MKSPGRGTLSASTAMRIAVMIPHWGKVRNVRVVDSADVGETAATYFGARDGRPVQSRGRLWHAEEPLPHISARDGRHAAPCVPGERSRECGVNAGNRWARVGA